MSKRLPQPGPGYIHRTDLSAATGISISQLTKLATDGHIPKGDNGWYDGANTLVALVKYYRNGAGRSSGADSKAELDAEKLEALKIRNDRMRGIVVARAWVAGKITELGGCIADIRQRSILEDAPVISAFAGDVGATRDVLAKRWAVITKAISDLAERLATEPENFTNSNLKTGKSQNT